MPKFTGRSNAACSYCHRQKVKCSGGASIFLHRLVSAGLLNLRAEQPCQRCRHRQRQCIYRTRGDRTIAVSEEYLDQLNATLNDLTNAVRVTGSSPLTPLLGPAVPRIAAAEPEPPGSATTQTQTEPEGEDAVAPLVEDSTAESFVRKLKEVLQNVGGGSDNALMTLAVAFPAAFSPSSSSCEGSTTSQRHHANMRFDTLRRFSSLKPNNSTVADMMTKDSNLSFKLPPYRYAVQLISQAEKGFGDYHTFLRRSFWKRLHATYKNLSSQVKDRNWLCRLSFILALAEANNHDNQSLTISLDGNGGVPSSHSGNDNSDDIFHTLPPGTEYFEQGLLMLKVPYEDPTVDDVEALNLAVCGLCRSHLPTDQPRLTPSSLIVASF